MIYTIFTQDDKESVNNQVFRARNINEAQFILGELEEMGYDIDRISTYPSQDRRIYYLSKRIE